MDCYMGSEEIMKGAIEHYGACRGPFCMVPEYGYNANQNENCLLSFYIVCDRHRGNLTKDSKIEMVS
jgi:hypothetical protein